MAWYEIEYKCGHKDRMQLYGPYTDKLESLDSPEKRADFTKTEKEVQK